MPPARDNFNHQQSNLSGSSSESSAYSDNFQKDSHDPVLQHQIQQNREISKNFIETADNKSAKAKLYEICATNYWCPPSFVCCNEEGPSHLRMFTCMVTIKVDTSSSVLVECVDEPKSQKKAAEEHAAQGAL
ncbi:hypothetical protein J5N97_021476 [Dioscorea zingiberensis]|uniref:DRBM domain-containing protein n=1 Tax=Dioscorea zingiberensis TaxID=325984 RepID=A0A9D5HER0_9LILI|nr:hypothetical protein J5N97_021476 [Dioscorea zingiberensis]